MKKLLVTGASGFLGWYVCSHPQKDWNIIGAWRNNKLGLKKGIQSIQLDLCNVQQTRKALRLVKPDAILHLAALSETGYCEKNIKESFSTNVTTTKMLTEFCAQQNIPFLFTSSGQVFDGLSRTYYLESNPPNPKNVYGKHKVQAENFIVKNYPGAIICRVPAMYGLSSKDSRNFMKEWLLKWHQGQSVTAFGDEIRSFLSGRSAAEGLFFLLNKRGQGIFHLAGAESLSRVEFAKKLKEAFKLSKAQIIEKKQSDFQFSAYRPPKVVFSCDKIKAMGFKPKMASEELNYYYSKY